MSAPLPPLPREPLVTVIVPSFNQGAYLEDTLRSVLRQDYPHLELWVVDGGSTDQTRGILRRYEADPRLRWLSEPDRGYADAVNKGLERARGQLIGIQSSDDFYGDGAIGEAVAHFARYPDLVMVSGTFYRVDRAGRPLAPYDALGDERWLSVEQCARTANYPCQSACLFRRDLARLVGGCDLELDWVADHDLLVRMMAAGAVRGGRTLKLNRYWAYVRQHPEQRNRQRLRFALGHVRAAEKYARSGADLFTPAARKLMLTQAYRGEYELRTRKLGQDLRALPAFARLVRRAHVALPPWYYVKELAWLLPLGLGRRVIQGLHWRLNTWRSRGLPAPGLPSQVRWFA